MCICAFVCVDTHRVSKRSVPGLLQIFLARVYVSVCMYVCVFVCVCVRVYACPYVHVYMWVCVRGNS